MKLVILICSMILAINTAAFANTNYPTHNPEKCTDVNIEECFLYNVSETTNTPIIAVEDINVLEIDEAVEINFDTAKYLPENFNVLKGKHDLDWNTIELIEIEEDVNLDFDTKQYLPKGFNSLKGKNDINWNKVELIEVDEDVELHFNTKEYLPKNFNAYKGMCKYSSKNNTLHS